MGIFADSLRQQNNVVINKAPIDAVKMAGSVCLSAFCVASQMKIDARLQPWLFNHRVDLHNAFKAFALRDDIPGRPAKIVGSTKIIRVDTAAGVVFSESGEKYEADLVIGADGIHSVTRDAVIGTRKIAQPSGHSAYRCLVSLRFEKDTIGED